MISVIYNKVLRDMLIIGRYSVPKIVLGIGKVMRTNNCFVHREELSVQIINFSKCIKCSL